MEKCDVIAVCKKRFDNRCKAASLLLSPDIFTQLNGDSYQRPRPENGCGESLIEECMVVVALFRKHGMYKLGLQLADNDNYNTTTVIKQI